MIERPTWQEYFTDMAVLASSRSTCLRRKVGAVLVRDNQVISTGYNGAPKHSPHCELMGCLRTTNNVPSGEKHELCRGVHAEQNVIIQAAINGVSTRDSDLYCTTHPCSICAKMIINAEIKTIYVLNGYPDKLSQRLLEEGNVEIVLVHKERGSMEKV